MMIIVDHWWMFMMILRIVMRKIRKIFHDDDIVEDDVGSQSQTKCELGPTMTRSPHY